MTNDGVWEDQKNNYPGSNFSGEQFDFEKLSNSKFELVEDFANQFPEALLDEQEDRIGRPDCYDQGGIYISWHKDGEQKSWTIDVRKEEIPICLHDFRDQVTDMIILLRE